MTFWQLSTYDLSPPTEKYRSEGDVLRALSRQEDTLYNIADRSSDRAKRATAHQHKEKRNRINTIISTLLDEAKEQTAARSFTLKRLAREKQHWFAHALLSDKGASGRFALAFVEHCLQPRCLLSPMDADFCAQIIKVIHLLGTPNFPTFKCYDVVSPMICFPCCLIDTFASFLMTISRSSYSLVANTKLGTTVLIIVALFWIFYELIDTI